MSNQHYSVVVLGAGVTGLTLAHHLNKKGTNFLVLDKKPRHGGVIHTKSKNGFIYESGPNTGVISHPEAVALFDDLKDLIRVEKGNDVVKTRFVMKNGKWHALPQGLISAVTTPLFSLKDKFRILGEPFRKPGVDPDESLAELVKRRMGKSFLDYAIDPFILGIYAGDPSLLITRHAMPKLYNLEQNYGSFIKGSIKKRKEPKSELEKRVDRAVFSIEGGLSQLTDALLKSAGEGNTKLGVDNVVIEPLNTGGYKVSYSQNGEDIEMTADKVVSTFGSVGLKETFAFISDEDMQDLTNLKYARVVEIALGFDQWNGRPLDGFGGLVPHKEKRDILGVLFMSSLFKNRAPKDGALLSVFMGGIRNEKLCDLDDEALMQVLEREMKDSMDLKKFEPSMVDIMRYSHAIPQYAANSDKRLAAIERVQKQHKGLIIAGNLRDGIGMADRIKQATIIAQEIN
ncbi:protoporphyrinogen oxidase [Carboxylicivirga linearis]|uniref:Coproporphyrinogen III oxidase n=1 Tax=Carboxylicivirga linearis TaxID=1628157 RepID=A0ABS5JP69_9BACT|nr:protoporphyrinogen oxidase [Carboxylicivirga linearis]MBS2096697.1 protoporphyrinogen oxidase [Carboxylicivirga linearis]